MSGEELIKRGREFYDEELKVLLEQSHVGRFVAVEPNNRKYFLRDSAVEAIESGREALPGEMFLLVRVGHSATHRCRTPFRGR